MSGRRWFFQQTLGGAVIFGLYGLVEAVGRLPVHLAPGLWSQSAAWTVLLLAGIGGAVVALTALLGILAGRCVRPNRRPAIVGGVQALILLPVMVWFLLNEFLYMTTSQTLGLDSLALLWHNTAAVLEKSWEMGGRYLIMTAVGAVMASGIVACLTARSFGKVMAGSPPIEQRSGSRRLPWGGATVMLIVGLLVGLVTTAPSRALTVACRAVPTLRAFDLNRVLAGDPLMLETSGPYGSPIVSDADYADEMGAPRQPAPNVVYILLESTPASALHCYGYPKADITPNLDQLAAEGVRFEHCLAPSSFSSCSVVSMATSLYMLRGPRFDYFNDVSFPFMPLPRALRLAGYETALFSSGNETFDNINRFRSPADFDVYFSHDTCDIPKQDSMRMDDKYAIGAFESWLDRRNGDRPFYTSFYLQSPHFNYEVPEPWFSHDQPIPPLFSNGDGILHIPAEVLPQLRNQYDNALRYADHWVGRIRAVLEKTGQMERTIIIAIGDHGEAFMEHGLARHGVHTWEEMIHIPLIFRIGAEVRDGLSIELPAVRPGTVTGLDVAPTVAALVGIAPHPSWQGLNVLDPDYTGQDRPIFSMTQYTRWQEVVFWNGFKFTCDLTDATEALFDLNTDPGETNNLVADRPELVSAMRTLLAGWHTRQLSYYADAQSSPLCYLGRYVPAPDVQAGLETVATASNE